jgi:hypothetical protein
MVVRAMAHAVVTDMPQTFIHRHGTDLYSPTWHRPLVTEMAHAFSHRHGTGI